MIRERSSSERRVLIMDSGDDQGLDSCDVVVELPTGERFGATFLTQNYIAALMEKNRSTGEFAGGVYLWASNMIIVERLDIDVIEATVDDLLSEGQLRLAFMRFEPVN